MSQFHPRATELGHDPTTGEMLHLPTAHGIGQQGAYAVTLPDELRRHNTTLTEDEIALVAPNPLTGAEKKILDQIAAADAEKVAADAPPENAH